MAAALAHRGHSTGMINNSDNKRNGARRGRGREADAGRTVVNSALME